MPQKLLAIKRFVALFDQHYPYCIPEFFDVANPKKDTPVLRFLKEFDPHVVSHGGDQLDLDLISHWNRGKPRLKEGKRLAEHYTGYNVLLDQIEKRTKSVERVDMYEGNHDYWIQLLIDEQPELLEGNIEVPLKLDLKKRGYTWMPQRTLGKYGKLYMMHGDAKNGYLPADLPKYLLGVYHCNLLYGHVHTNKSATATSPVDVHPYQAQSVGTLANRNPIWKRNEASSWLNSFAAGYILPDGNFNLYVINIVNGKFVFDGQLYQ